MAKKGNSGCTSGTCGSSKSDTKKPNSTQPKPNFGTKKSK